MYQIKQSSQCKRDIKSFQHRRDIITTLQDIVIRLASGERLEKIYLDHPLMGSLQGKRECHIKPNVLLIYEIDEKQKILTLLRLGTHADAFKK